ncbi:MAG: HAD family hydrolase [Gemmatimonadaceae bacterium]
MSSPSHHASAAWSGGDFAYRGVVFDLDGVITDTARVHAAVWKLVLDDYLQQRADSFGERFLPFDEVEDYLRFVDGKSRYDGVRSFLASRRIVLAEGAPADSPERETVSGLGNRKDRLFLTALERDGVSVFDGTIALARELSERGVRIAVASSSKNAPAILTRAELNGLFAVCVDGAVAAERGLQGKPAPDIFLACAAQLAVAPSDCVIVEDAVSGVTAARAGGFRLVIGLAHGAEGDKLLANGADVVVPNCDDVSAHTIDAWCRAQSKT